MGTPTSMGGLDAGSGNEVFLLEGGVRSPDGLSLHGVQGAELVTVDARSGELTSSVPVGPGLEASVTSEDGRVALVTEGSPAFPDAPAGRTSTPIQIVDTRRDGGGEPNRFWELEGNYEPEAFSRDGKSLFLIEYLPAEAPDRYRVTLMDTKTGKVRGMPSADKVPQSWMQGERVQQVFSPDRKVLYTLYESYSTDNEGIAFVHVLHLGQMWAHCVDLPIEMGVSPSWYKALAMSPDGARLYVTDAGTDTVVQLRTRDLWRQIDPISTPLPTPSSTASARADVSEDGVLWVSGGDEVARLATDDLAPIGKAWTLPSKIHDLQVTDDGSVALALLEEEIVARWGFNGRPAGSIAAEDVERIVSFEPGQ